jgi:uncharacterized protein (DUF58 family)
MMGTALAPAAIRARATPNGRLPYALTPRTLLLLLAGTLWLAPAFFLHAFAWATLGWDLLVLALAAIDARRLPAPASLEVERIWHAAPALGASTEVELRLLQTGNIILTCTLLDDLPAALLPEPTPLRLEAYPRAWAAVRYTLSARERGDHSGGRLFLRYRSSLALAERWAVADLAQTVRVYPAIGAGEDQSLFLARTRQIDLQRRHRQRGLGRDFESLRDYHEGDDLRDICWTATARRGSLVSRQYQVERSQAVWVVLDAGRLLQSRVGAYSKLDYAAATALAFAQLALYSGDKVGLLAYGAATQQRLAPSRGATHLRQMMDALALVASETGEADHLRATVELARLQPRRSLVLWLTDLAETAMRPEVIDGAAQLMRRHLVLFVAIRQGDLRALATAEPKDARAMFEAAAAQELMARRDLLLARMREGGALTLETTPASMTAAVLNRYLEVKEKGLL